MPRCRPRLAAGAGGEGGQRPRAPPGRPALRALYTLPLLPSLPPPPFWEALLSLAFVVPGLRCVGTVEEGAIMGVWRVEVRQGYHLGIRR